MEYCHKFRNIPIIVIHTSRNYSYGLKSSKRNETGERTAAHHKI